MIWCDVKPEPNSDVIWHWALPKYSLDLYVEFRNQTNGLELPGGRSLLGALVYHGLDAMDAVEKDNMRQLAMRGDPYTSGESQGLLDYCESDVSALETLLMATLPKLDVPRVVYRGNFMKTVPILNTMGYPSTPRYWQSCVRIGNRSSLTSFSVWMPVTEFMKGAPSKLIVLPETPPRTVLCRHACRQRDQ